ncbi:hypothetical protein PCE1_001582 [Barthelona sp. PCE]
MLHIKVSHKLELQGIGLDLTTSEDGSMFCYSADDKVKVYTYDHSEGFVHKIDFTYENCAAYCIFIGNDHLIMGTHYGFGVYSLATGACLHESEDSWSEEIYAMESFTISESEFLFAAGGMAGDFRQYKIVIADQERVEVETIIEMDDEAFCDAEGVNGLAYYDENRLFVFVGDSSVTYIDPMDPDQSPEDIAEPVELPDGFSADSVSLYHMEAGTFVACTKLCSVTRDLEFGEPVDDFTVRSVVAMNSQYLGGFTETEVCVFDAESGQKVGSFAQQFVRVALKGKPGTFFFDVCKLESNSHIVFAASLE